MTPDQSPNPSPNQSPNLLPDRPIAEKVTVTNEQLQMLLYVAEVISDILDEALSMLDDVLACPALPTPSVMGFPANEQAAKSAVVGPELLERMRTLLAHNAVIQQRIGEFVDAAEPSASPG